MRSELSVLLIVFCAAGCADQAPVQPTAVDNDSPRIHGQPTSLASRPLKGQCETTFSATSRPAPGTCAVFEPVTSAFISIHGVCQLTHLGRSTTEAIQQLVFALDTQGQPILLNGQPVVSRLVNCAGFTAPNGDRLEFTAVASTSAGPTTETVAFAGTVSFVGGTGRFADAKGTASINGGANLATRTGRFFMNGTVAY